jgi:hypothetical protein
MPAEILRMTLRARSAFRLSCLATILPSLPDKKHWPIETPRIVLSLPIGSTTFWSTIGWAASKIVEFRAINQTLAVPAEIVEGCKRNW